jgi:transcriptional regulator with XRE-family HTH domain
MPTAEKRTRGKGIILAGLKDARENAGLSLRELEAATGRRVYQSTISDLENLRRGAQPRTARKLAEALGVTVKDLRGTG